MKRALLLLTAALCVACNREKAGHASASAYTSDADTSARAAGIPGTNSGAELEAPRLVPAVQNQLNLMSTGPQAVDPDNLTAYKNMVTDLASSMTADLYRVGYADSGNFKALKDSVLDDLGGAAGSDAKLDRSKVQEHVARMRRLIALYQHAMRSAGDRQ